MKYDNGKVDEATLALMYLVSFKMDKDLPGCSAWKSFNWDTLDRLHDKGLISNPHGKAKSVRMSDEGFSKAEELFEKMFGIEE